MGVWPDGIHPLRNHFSMMEWWIHSWKWLKGVAIVFALCEVSEKWLGPAIHDWPVSRCPSTATTMQPIPTHCAADGTAPNQTRSTSKAMAG